MKRTQIWCDQCGREMVNKVVENGDGSYTTSDPETTWEMWAKDNDWVFCSLLCLYHKAGNLIMAQDIKEANEGN